MTTIVPETLAQGSDTAHAVERALASLSGGYREVLVLVVVEGLEQDRVAAILGIEYAAVRKRLSRARALLADALARGESTVGATPRGTTR